MYLLPCNFKCKYSNTLYSNTHSLSRHFPTLHTPVFIFAQTNCCVWHTSPLPFAPHQFFYCVFAMALPSFMPIPNPEHYLPLCFHWFLSLKMNQKNHIKCNVALLMLMNWCTEKFDENSKLHRQTCLTVKWWNFARIHLKTYQHRQITLHVKLMH